MKGFCTFEKKYKEEFEIEFIDGFPVCKDDGHLVIIYEDDEYGD